MVLTVLVLKLCKSLEFQEMVRIQMSFNEIYFGSVELFLSDSVADSCFERQSIRVHDVRGVEVSLVCFLNDMS